MSKTAERTLRFPIRPAPTRDGLIEVVAAALCLGDDVVELQLRGVRGGVDVEVMFQSPSSLDRLDVAIEPSTRIPAPGLWYGILQRIEIVELPETTPASYQAVVDQIYRAANKQRLHGVIWVCGSQPNVQAWAELSDKTAVLFNLPLIQSTVLHPDDLLLLCASSRRQHVGRATLGILVHLPRNVSEEEDADNVTVQDGTADVPERSSEGGRGRPALGELRSSGRDSGRGRAQGQHAGDEFASWCALGNDAETSSEAEGQEGDE